MMMRIVSFRVVSWGTRLILSLSFRALHDCRGDHAGIGHAVNLGFAQTNPLGFEIIFGFQFELLERLDEGGEHHGSVFLREEFAFRREPIDVKAKAAARIFLPSDACGFSDAFMGQIGEIKSLPSLRFL